MRHALVTGASAGLGYELARQLVLDRGMTVLATARRRDRLEALAAGLPEGRVAILDGDLADPDFRARLWEWAEATSGGIDVLVNNAGLGHYDDFAAQDPAEIRRVVEVNLIALMDLTQRAIRSMRPRGAGQVVQVSSVLGFVGLPYAAAYAASKHAVNGLVESLRYELRGSGVRVWAACPARTESEFIGVAIGPGATQAPRPMGEPTARVVRGIVRGIDRRGRRAFVMPTLQARAVVALARWLPGPFGWAMGRWSAMLFAREIRAGRPGFNPPSPP